MANVNNINESAGSFPLPQVKNPQKNGTPSFENVLNSAIDQGQTSRTTAGRAHGLNEISSPAPDIELPANRITDKTDKLLALLESYSSKLENPRVSLKNIAPVMEDIKNNAGALLQETSQLTEADASLKKIANQAAVTAQTEYLKFQRGDYLS
jgi:hypothetical protein